MAQAVSTIAQVRALSAPAKVYLWEMIIPQVPGAAVAASQAMTLRARNVQFPGISVMSAVTYFMGLPIKKHPTRRNYAHTFTMIFEEGLTMPIHEALYGWHEAWQGAETGEGEGEEVVLVPAFLRPLNHQREVIASIKLSDVFVENIPEVDMAYESGDLLKFNVTFGYGHWVRE